VLLLAAAVATDDDQRTITSTSFVERGRAFFLEQLFYVFQVKEESG
jgi:hypothetical protein